ncbi:MAG TPA: hypothetical protein VHY35_20765 [Stellaceae bacterium]|jgi:hypothetical protein|nr:hypothetical protein [Stellaceae bacterium]
MASLLLVMGVVILLIYVISVTMVQSTHTTLHTYMIIAGLSLTAISAVLAVFNPANWTIGP